MTRPSALFLVGLIVFLPVRGRPPQAKSGLDPSTFDSSIRPQDDLYRFVNGRWLADTEIPADRVAYGAFTELTEKAESDLRAIIEETAAAHPRTGPKQQIADLYLSGSTTRG